MIPVYSFGMFAIGDVISFGFDAVTLVSVAQANDGTLYFVVSPAVTLVSVIVLATKRNETRQNKVNRKQKKTKLDK